MAKEIVIKIKVDGQEIDVAKKSTMELNQQIGELRRKLEEVPIGSKDFKKIQGDIDNLEGAFKKAKQSQQGFIQNLSELPGIAGLAGQSIKGIKGAMDLLAANPLIAVFSLLAMVVLKVVDKLKEMQGIMDPLEKLAKVFSGTFEALANIILPPIAFVIEKIVDAATALVNVFSDLIGLSSKVGDNMSYVADTMDQLDDSAARFALSQAEANRQLQDAREIAADSTKTVGERVNALKDAEKTERQIAAASRQRELDRARAQAVDLASTLGYTQSKIEAIKRYDGAQLKSFAIEIDGLKGLNREKSNALFQSLGVIEDVSAREAKIGKKTQAQITSIENEERQKRVEAAKQAAQQKKDFEDRLATFMNDIRLLGIKDEQEKARTSLDIEKDKTIKEINALEMKEARKKQLRLAAEQDYAAKSAALLEKQQLENTKLMDAFNQKVKDIEIAAIEDETQRSITAREEKLARDKEAIQKDTQFLKKSKEEQNQILVNLEKASAVDIQKIKDDAAKKNAELLYKQIEFERQSRLMLLQVRLQQIDISNKAEVQKIKERRALLDEQAKIDFDKELENLKKLYDAKEVNDKDYLDRKAALEEQYNTKIAANTFNTELAITEQRKKNNAAIMQLADSIGALGVAMGQETAAGKALIRVQQGLALATTSLAIAQAFMGLGKDLAKGFPVNIIAVASTIALIATAISQFKALTTPLTSGADTGGGTGGGSSAPSPNLGRNYADGGLIGGKRHAEGGTLIEAEQGEAIMTRGSVTMFGPLLSALNQAGGGKSFAPNAMVASYDNPQLNNPAQTQSPVIMKTYVVSNELTTESEKQARLKNLSTL
jgi:hypothetical protein